MLTEQSKLVPYDEKSDDIVHLMDECQCLIGEIREGLDALISDIDQMLAEIGPGT